MKSQNSLMTNKYFFDVNILQWNKWNLKLNINEDGRPQNSASEQAFVKTRNMWKLVVILYNERASFERFKINRKKSHPTSFWILFEAHCLFPWKNCLKTLYLQKHHRTVSLAVYLPIFFFFSKNKFAFV